MASRGRGGIVLLALAALLGGACREAAPRPNVVLISLDTLRADSLGSYGYEHDTTPFLDELAARGVLFENAFVNTLPTTPSHATLLSSQYQESHGLLWDGRSDDTTAVERMPDSVPMLQEIMTAAGYRTLAVTDGGNFGERQGFARGWTEFLGKRAKGIVTGSKTLLALLDRHLPSDRPLFVLFHTYEVHAPYDPPAEYREMFGTLPESDFQPTAENLRAVIDTAARDLSEADLAKSRRLYDAGIRFTDDRLRQLFDQLIERGLFDGDYLVVITSDHGEEFGEHGGVLHRGLLYDELIRVPLIAFGSTVPEGVVRKELVSAIDIAPTILAAAGIPAAAGMQGRDLFSERSPSRLDDVIFSQFRNRRYAVRTPHWKFISSGTFELYDLTADPGETRDVSRQHLDKVDEFRRLLEAWRAGQEGRRPEPGEAVPLTEEQIEELRALGYVN